MSLTAISTSEAKQLDVLFRVLFLVWDNTCFKSSDRQHEANRLYEKFEREIAAFTLDGAHLDDPPYENPWAVMTDNEICRIDTLIFTIVDVWKTALEKAIERELDSARCPAPPEDHTPVPDEIPW